VAGNERGIPDVVLDGTTGVLTPPGDDVAFAVAVDRLLDDVDLRKRLSRGAQDFVSRERTVQVAADLLGEIIP
jgi:glycosyltransferase involved in cell wall biosynthesis